MGLTTFFFDTYAFCEFLVGNPAYKIYAEQFDIATTQFNLMEVHYWLLRNYTAAVADASYDKLLKYVVAIDDNLIKDANKWRFLHKEKKMSYVDCMGYVLAKRLGIKFLTGDQQFAGLENVEYVK